MRSEPLRVLVIGDDPLARSGVAALLTSGDLTVVASALPSSAQALSRVPAPEVAVTPDKRHALARMARQFLRARRAESAPYRFDVLAIESRAGQRPTVRLHKGAFHPETR